MIEAWQQKGRKRQGASDRWLAAVLLLALAPGLVGAAPPRQQAMVHPMVWEALQTGGEAQVLVVLRAQADLSGADVLPTKEAKGRYVYEALRAVAQASQRGLRAALDQQAAEYQAFYIVNALKVKANLSLVQSLAARSDVARIVPNLWVKGIPEVPSLAAAAAPDGLEQNLIRVHADDAWALGYAGQGTVVAGQDTGYQWDHPALKNQYRGWNGTSADHDYNWHDAIHEDNPNTPAGNPCGFDSPVPCDDHGHGTHTMGTIVGDDGAENRIGTAPEARWMACRNMEQAWGTPATYLECFEFFLAPYPVGGTPAQGDPSLAPQVVNNSWRCPPAEGCDADTLEGAVEALRQAGIVVVVSAGNSGPACGTVNGPPGQYEQAFSAGAFDHRSGTIASFSSRGPATYGGESYLKPDIAAPGVSIRSSVPGGGYGLLSGTSMAAPHVAGGVAVLLSASPDYAGRVDAIEQALTSTAEPKASGQCGDPGPPNNVWGWGILDLLATVEAVTAGSLRGVVTDIDSGLPIAAAEVAARLKDWPAVGAEATADPWGWYTLTLPAATYNVTAEASGYISQTMTSITVSREQTTTLDMVLSLSVHRVYLPQVVQTCGGRDCAGP